MSILENKDKFRDDWKAAIEDIQISPPGRVWDKIDRSLAYAEASRFRKMAHYYKWAAVTAILIAFAVSIPYTWSGDGSSTDRDLSQLVSSGNTDVPLLFTSTVPQTAPIRSAFNNDKVETNQIVVGLHEPPEEEEVRVTPFQNYSLPGALEKKELRGYDVDLDALAVNPVPIYHFQRLSLNRNTQGKFWAGVGVGSSSFDPNYQLNTANVVADALLSSQPNFINTTDNGRSLSNVSEEINQGVNYQIGLNMGMRVTRRWTLESGMNYGEAFLSTTTNVVIENRYFSKAVALTSEASNFQEVERIAKTSEIVEYVEDDVIMDNTFQFASFPIKAGYILIDKKLNIRLNAGLITNIYLGNTLVDPDRNLATIEINPGDDSPYRTVNFSGLAGITVGYRLLDNFDLLLEPNYSQSLQPLTKTSSNFAATPSGLGISAGIRYNFKR